MDYPPHVTLLSDGAGSGLEGRVELVGGVGSTISRTSVLVSPIHAIAAMQRLCECDPLHRMPKLLSSPRPPHFSLLAPLLRVRPQPTSYSFLSLPLNKPDFHLLNDLMFVFLPPNVIPNLSKFPFSTWDRFLYSWLPWLCLLVSSPLP